jgi:hypothetical protein
MSHRKKPQPKQQKKVKAKGKPLSSRPPARHLLIRCLILLAAVAAFLSPFFVSLFMPRITNEQVELFKVGAWPLAAVLCACAGVKPWPNQWPWQKPSS